MDSILRKVHSSSNQQPPRCATAGSSSSLLPTINNQVLPLLLVYQVCSYHQNFSAAASQSPFPCLEGSLLQIQQPPRWLKRFGDCFYVSLGVMFYGACMHCLAQCYSFCMSLASQLLVVHSCTEVECFQSAKTQWCFWIAIFLRHKPGKNEIPP